ncbi:MAG: phenylalanine--tRNA ligase subunit beta [candidate division WOR-3 bacterium]|nr:phenylalanine--tRNA ligase subunit beta [candidate division WOR-3 bacterium]
MPVVAVPLNILSRLTGKMLTPEEIIGLLGELGCDVEGFEPLTNRLKLNLLPARPDMFDVCGLARCLRGYLGVETGLKEYAFDSSGITVQVAKGLEEVRRFIVAAVIKNVRLDEEQVAVLMEMQENLHWGLGRDRRRASIGIYDLSTVAPDFVYRPVAPDGVRFAPLGGVELKGTVPLTPAEILEFHPKGRAYRHLLADYKVYPLLTDSNGKVLSMPPIINSDETKVTEKSRELFVDVTGPDEWAVKKCLAVVAAAFADLGGEVQTVRVVYPAGRADVTPDMTPERMTVNLDDVVAVVGVQLPPDKVVELLRRMRYEVVKESVRPDAMEVLIPAYRVDVLHPWDIVEDVAIAYGYHHLPRKLIPTVTTSRPQAIEEFSQLCRRVLIGLGFIETMTLALTCPEVHFVKLNLQDDGRSVQLENPATVEQTILRRHLFSGLLETFSINTTQPLPQQIFEVGDVFRVDEKAETGTITQRHLAVGMADAKAGFADIKAVIEAVNRELDFTVAFVPSDEMPFIPGRCAVLQTSSGKRVGILGEVHPEVLERFGLTVPLVMAEVDIECLQAERTLPRH